MALSRIHPPPAFLQTAGEPSVPWKDWLEAFDQYVIATGIVDSGEGKPRLRSLLTHCLGLEGQRILGTARTVTSYDELRTLLTQEFGPRVNAMVERLHFRQRAQPPGESVRHYVFVLRTLAATCKFGALTDEMIRDQLIEKTTLSQILNRLLMEAESLTLGNALTLSIRVEEAGRDSALMQASAAKKLLSQENHQAGKSFVECKSEAVAQVESKSQRPGNSYGTSSSSASQKCGNCGFTFHKGSTCPAKGQKCRTCSRIGHYARCCRSADSTGIHEVTTEDALLWLEPVSLNVIKESGGVAYKRCDCQLGEEVVSLVVDLGAKVSVLCRATYCQGLSHYQLHPPDRRLLRYAGRSIPLLGMIFVPVRYRGVYLTDFPFYVAKEGTDLLGMDLFEALGFQIALDRSVERHQTQKEVNAVKTLEDDNQLGGHWESRWPTVFKGLGVARYFQHRLLLDPSVHWSIM